MAGSSAPRSHCLHDVERKGPGLVARPVGPEHRRARVRLRRVDGDLARDPVPLGVAVPGLNPVRTIELKSVLQW